MIFLIVFLVSVGCGKKQVTQFKVDPLLMPYYSKMVANGKSRGKNISTNDLILKFGSTDTNVLGYCQTYTQTNWKFLTEEVVSTPIVVINKEFFNSAGEVGRRELISHELGHCLMAKNHDQRVASNGYAESLMYPYFINETVFGTYENSYLDQLFGLKALAFTDNGGNGNVASTIAPEGNKQAFRGYEGVKVTTHYFLKDGCEGEKDLHNDLDQAKDYHSTEDIINEKIEE